MSSRRFPPLAGIVVDAAVVDPPRRSSAPMSRRLISGAGSALATGFLLSSLSEESSFLADEMPEKREFFICSLFSSTTGFGGSGFLFNTEVAGVETADGV